MGFLGRSLVTGCLLAQLTHRSELTYDTGFLKSRSLFGLPRIVFREFWRLSGALTFYTIIPLPKSWPLDFSKVASWAPGIGILLGLLLGGTDLGLERLHCPWHLRNCFVLLFWVWITGGLHLDGVIDSADGLAVPDPERRLSVMQDSRTGAYGVMAAIALVLLKYAALLDWETHRLYGFVLVATWGRWGQFWAVCRYPYLKTHGKGAFHRQHLSLTWDSVRALLALLGVVLFPWIMQWDSQITLTKTNGIGLIIAWAVGAWFCHRFRGMTGDIYGAIVEWIEALTLASLGVL